MSDVAYKARREIFYADGRLTSNGLGYLKPIEICARHRRYRGKGKPRSICEQCWRIWFYVKGEML